MDPVARKRVFSNAFDPSDDPDPKSSAEFPPASSSYSDFNVSFSGDDMLGCYSPTEPAICMDPDTGSFAQSDESEVGPAALGLQKLSLHDVTKMPLPKVHSSRITAARTTVFIVKSYSLQHWFANIDPSDIVICFDKGDQAVKTKNYVLSQASPFFAKLLNGPYLDGHTRCVRLRHDFPAAIISMMQFLEHGVYVLPMALRMQYPNFTRFDLHVHAYIVGAKYGVSELCRHALGEYTRLSSMVLSMGLRPVDSENMYDIASSIDSLLNSLVLIWRNTPHREDPLRQAVLELLKPVVHYLLRVPFFQTLLFDLTGFGDDVLNSLEEDGFDIRVYLTDDGLQDSIGVSFKHM